MKIKVSFTVEVDSAAWMSEYGVEPSDVRNDVRQYIEQAFLAQIAELGLNAETARS